MTLNSAIAELFWNPCHLNNFEYCSSGVVLEPLPHEWLWILQQRSCFGTPAAWMTLNTAVAELFRTPAAWMTLNPQQPSSFSVIYVGQICYVALINEKGFHQPAGWLQKVMAVNGMVTHIRTLFYIEDKSQMTANKLTNMATKMRISDLFDDKICEMFVASYPTSAYAHYIHYNLTFRWPCIVINSYNKTN